MKYVNIFYVLLFALILFSCNKTNGKQVLYGMEQVFRLVEGEQEVTASKERVKIYEVLCTPVDISIPINKIIESKNYGIYIAFADTSIKTSQYLEKLTADSSKILISKKNTYLNTIQANAVLFSVNNVFITQYWKSSKVPGMNEVFSLITKDSTLAKGVFDNSDFLQSRLDK